MGVGCRESFIPSGAKTGAATMIIDETDRKILEELRKNAKITTRELAKSLQVKRSTVHDRISKLIKEKIIEQFTIKVRNDAVEESYLVFLLVEAKEWQASMLHPFIKEVHHISGEYDFLLKVKCRDVHTFNQFIKVFKAKQGIQKIATLIGTETLKE